MEAFKKCGITKKFEKYFYIQIENDVCKLVKFKDIKNFVYERVPKQSLGKEENQITVEFLLDDEEHSITFPDFKVKNVELLHGKRTVMLRLPIGLAPGTKFSEGPRVTGGYIWDTELYSTPWLMCNAIATLICIVCILNHKMG